MKLNDIECVIENAEKNTGQLVEKKEEIESHEAHLQNAINKLEQDVQISKLLIEEKNDFSEQKSEIEQEIEKYKSEIIEIQDELNLMLSEAEENMRTLEDLEAVGEDVSETVNIIQERKELIAEYEEQLKEIMDRLGMDFEGNQFEQKTDLSSNNTSPSMSSNSQEYQIANPDISDHNIQNNARNKDRKNNNTHFSSTYSLKPNEQYEANRYGYETDRYGRIKRCEGRLRLEDGKRNTSHQVKAGGEYRLETDEGGHLIGRRFGGSEKVDNIVPMDSHVNHIEYKKLEDEWSQELQKGNTVDVKIRCIYEEESIRPTTFVVKYKVIDQEGFARRETRRIKNIMPGGGNNE